MTCSLQSSSHFQLEDAEAYEVFIRSAKYKIQPNVKPSWWEAAATSPSPAYTSAPPALKALSPTLAKLLSELWQPESTQLKAIWELSLS